MPKRPSVKLDSGVVTLGWVSFLSDVASDMIFPLLPDFLTRTLKAGPAAIGVIEGVAEATSSFMKMVSGWWSDRVRRRKPLIVAGYSIAAVVRPLVGLAASWTQVLAHPVRRPGRQGHPHFAARRAARGPRAARKARPRLRPAARDGQRRRRRRAAARRGLAQVRVRGRALGLSSGGDPGTRDRRPARFRRERIPEGPARIPPRRRTPSGPLPRRLKAAIGIFVVFTLASSTDAFLLLRASNAGVALWQLPLLWAFFNGVKAAAGVPGGALADRLGRVPAIVAGWTVYAVSYVGFAFVSSPGPIWALFGFYALFYALTEGAERALVADLAPARLRGRAFGAFHATVGFASLPASILFGLWWKAFGPRGAFLIGAGIAVAATAALLVFRSRSGPLRVEERETASA